MIMAKLNDIMSVFKENMKKNGKVIILPKDSPLRAIFNIPFIENVELEKSEE